jgi:hypothetical protein
MNCNQIFSKRSNIFRYFEILLTSRYSENTNKRVDHYLNNILHLDFVLSNSSETPSFSWHETEKSADGIPNLRIEFPEGQGHDEVILKHMLVMSLS